MFQMRKLTPEEEERLARILSGKGAPKYPDGKMNPSDEGALLFQIGVDVQHKVIRIDFNKPVLWMGMNMESAMAFHKAFAEQIRILAKELRGKDDVG